MTMTALKLARQSAVRDMRPSRWVLFVVLVGVPGTVFMRSPFAMTAECVSLPERRSCWERRPGAGYAGQGPHGARVSLIVECGAPSVSAVIGIVVGGLAGFFGGYTSASSGCRRLFQVIHQFFLAIPDHSRCSGPPSQDSPSDCILSWPSTA